MGPADPQVDYYQSNSIYSMLRIYHYYYCDFHYIECTFVPQGRISHLAASFKITAINDALLRD
jgi:hypothetical protein